MVTQRLLSVTEKVFLIGSFMLILSCVLVRAFAMGPILYFSRFIAEAVHEAR